MRATILALACLAAACSSSRRGAVDLDAERAAAPSRPAVLEHARFEPRAPEVPARPRASPHGAVPPPSVEPAPSGAGSIGASLGKAPKPSPSSLPESKVAAGGVKAGPGAPAVSAPASAGRAPRGDEGPAAHVVFAVAGPEGGPAPNPDAAAAASAPPLSGVDKDEIARLLKARLDVGAYRVQMSATRDFEPVLFDRTYDAMKDINLYEEFLTSGVKADRDAYWVRIAFIDLLEIEKPFTDPRLYGLDKKRRDDK